MANRGLARPEMEVDRRGPTAEPPLRTRSRAKLQTCKWSSSSMTFSNSKLRAHAALRSPQSTNAGRRCRPRENRCDRIPRSKWKATGSFMECAMQISRVPIGTRLVLDGTPRIPKMAFLFPFPIAFLFPILFPTLFLVSFSSSLPRCGASACWCAASSRASSDYTTARKSYLAASPPSDSCAALGKPLVATAS